MPKSTVLEYSTRKAGMVSFQISPLRNSIHLHVVSIARFYAVFLITKFLEFV